MSVCLINGSTWINSNYPAIYGGTGLYKVFYHFENLMENSKLAYWAVSNPNTLETLIVLLVYYVARYVNPLPLKRD